MSKNTKCKKQQRHPAVLIFIQNQQTTTPKDLTSCANRQWLPTKMSIDENLLIPMPLIILPMGPILYQLLYWFLINFFRLVQKTPNKGFRDKLNCANIFWAFTQYRTRVENRLACANLQCLMTVSVFVIRSLCFLFATITANVII